MVAAVRMRGWPRRRSTYHVVLVQAAPAVVEQLWHDDGALLPVDRSVALGARSGQETSVRSVCDALGLVLVLRFAFGGPVEDRF